LTAGARRRFDNAARRDYHTPGMIVFYWSAPAPNNATLSSPLHIHTLDDVGGRQSVTAAAAAAALMS